MFICPDDNCEAPIEHLKHDLMGCEDGHVFRITPIPYDEAFPPDEVLKLSPLGRYVAEHVRPVQL